VNEVRLGAELGDAVRRGRLGDGGGEGLGLQETTGQLGGAGGLDRVTHASTGGVVGLDGAGLTEQEAAVAVLDARQRSQPVDGAGDRVGVDPGELVDRCVDNGAALIEAGHVALVERAVLRTVDVGRVAGLRARAGPRAEIVRQGAVDGGEAGRGIGDLRRGEGVADLGAARVVPQTRDLLGDVDADGRGSHLRITEAEREAADGDPPRAPTTCGAAGHARGRRAARASRCSAGPGRAAGRGRGYRRSAAGLRRAGGCAAGPRAPPRRG
jgi:hypothetical protein